MHGSFLLFLILAPVPMEDVRPAGMDGLDWLAGSWQMTRGNTRLEEHWLPVAGNSMFGINRTIVGDRTAAFEFLRIEARPEGIFYVAQPGGRSGTDFKLSHMDGEKAVFENPQHDHPRIIRYFKKPDGSMLAQIEGNPGGQHRIQDFHYRRMQ